MIVSVRAAECHEDVCLDVEGVRGHVTNVNPVFGTDTWRVDCDYCGTCVNGSVPSKREALEAAKAHVVLTYDEYWDSRQRA